LFLLFNHNKITDRITIKIINIIQNKISNLYNAHIIHKNNNEKNMKINKHLQNNVDLNLDNMEMNKY